MNKLNLLRATQIINNDYLNAEKILKMSINTNINAAIAESKAFEDLSQIKPENKTSLSKENTTFQLKPASDKLSSLNLDRQQDKLIEIASSLTRDPSSNDNQFEVSMNQIDCYQIWRDKNDIAIVDSKENQLVAYGSSSQDFFLQKIESHKLKDFNTDNKLLSKIVDSNSQIKIKYDDKNIENAYHKLRPLDPVFQFLNRDLAKSKKSMTQKVAKGANEIFNTLRKYAKSAASKTEQIANKLLLNAKERTDKIANSVLGDRLMKESFFKFKCASQRTGEDKYQFGEYIVQKIDLTNIQVRNKNQELLVSFDVKEQANGQKPRLKMNFCSQNPTSLNKAVKVVSERQNVGVGNKAIDREYKVKVFNLVKELTSYPNGKSQLGNSNNHVFKTDNSITVRDKKGKKLIVANEHQNLSSASLDELQKLGQAIETDKDRARQQHLVEKIAPTIKQYLDLNDCHQIEKDNFSVSYDSKSKVLNYQDKVEPSISLSAELVRGQWQNIKTNISRSKEKYFEEVAQKTEDYLSRQKATFDSGREKSTERKRKR